MPFINEYIPEADKKKYNITSNNHFYRAGTSSWTVDRERDMFLMRRTGPHPEGIPGQIHWAFYWHGNLLDVLLQTIATGGDESISHGWAHKKLLHIGGITPEMQAQRTQIIDDLREVLTANRGLGVLSEYKTYDLTLDAE